MQGRQARRACQQARPGILRTRKKHALQLTCLNGQLTATAAAYFLLFTSSSLTTALPAAVATGRFGSMSLVIPQTAIGASQVSQDVRPGRRLTIEATIQL